MAHFIKKSENLSGLMPKLLNAELRYSAPRESASKIYLGRCKSKYYGYASRWLRHSLVKVVAVVVENTNDL